MTPDPRDKRFRRYLVSLYRHSSSPPGGGSEIFRIIVHLNINDSLRRQFKTYEEALRVFDSVKPYSTRKTLWWRLGFRTW